MSRSKTLVDEVQAARERRKSRIQSRSLLSNHKFLMCSRAIPIMWDLPEPDTGVVSNFSR